MDNEGLRLGMFLGGLIMASVPVSLGIGIGIYALRQYQRGRASGINPDGGAPTTSEPLSIAAPSDGSMD